MANNDGWLLYQGDGEIEDKSVIRVRFDISVTSIPNNAFKSCRSLTEVTITNSVTSLGSHAFYGCHALTMVELPKGITSIPAFTFLCCKSLMDFRIPAAVRSIEDRAFYSCTALTAIDLPVSVTSIGRWAFAFCKSLTRIFIPNSVTEIWPYAFRNCVSLVVVRLPQNPGLVIGNKAFIKCNALKTLDLPRIELSVWPRFLEQFNVNCHFERIGITGEVGRKTIVFSFLRQRAPQLFEQRKPGEPNRGYGKAGDSDDQSNSVDSNPSADGRLAYYYSHASHHPPKVIEINDVEQRPSDETGTGGDSDVDSHSVPDNPSADACLADWYTNALQADDQIQSAILECPTAGSLVGNLKVGSDVFVFHDS
jgi:hypothetical protein